MRKASVVIANSNWTSTHVYGDGMGRALNERRSPEASTNMLPSFKMKKRSSSGKTP